MVIDGSRLRRALSARWSATRRRPIRWWVGAVVTGVVLLAAVVGIVAHYRTPHAAPVLGVSAFAPYLMIAAPVALLIFGLLRTGVGVLLALAATVWCAAIQAPLFVATAAPAPGQGDDVTVMTANLRLGQGDPHAVVSAVRRHHVDVLMTEEMTPALQQGLEAAGLGRLLPYKVTDARDSAMGTGLWSRYRLADSRRREDFSFAFVTARITLPGVAAPVQLAAGHMPGPWPHSALWGNDIRHLPAVLQSFPSGSPVIMGGDFNATPDVAQFRHLLTGGYADAADQAGAGVTATYPSNHWYPPLIAIDHVLTRGAVARSVSTVQIPHSDHRALIASVRVPTGTR